MANFTLPFKIAARQGWVRLLENMKTSKIPYAPLVGMTYRVQCQVVRTGILRVSPNLGVAGAGFEVTLDGALSQEIDLHSAMQSRFMFPANVDILRGAAVKVRTNTTGTTTCTAELGDTGDPNGLLTASNLHTGSANRVIRTSGAAEYDVHAESAFIPTLTLVSTVENLSALSAGAWDIEIPFAPRAA